PLSLSPSLLYRFCLQSLKRSAEFSRGTGVPCCCIVLTRYHRGQRCHALPHTSNKAGNHLSCYKDTTSTRQRSMTSPVSLSAPLQARYGAVIGHPHTNGSPSGDQTCAPARLEPGHSHHYRARCARR